MSQILKTSIALLVITLGVSAAEASLISSQVCLSTTEDLSQEQAIARTQWARKCFPHLRGMLRGADAAVIQDAYGNPYRAFPVFGLVNQDGSVAQFWNAPLNSSADCETPENSAFLGICVADRDASHARAQQIAAAKAAEAAAAAAARAAQEAAARAAAEEQARRARQQFREDLHDRHFRNIRY